MRGTEKCNIWTSCCSDHCCYCCCSFSGIKVDYCIIHLTTRKF